MNSIDHNSDTGHDGQAAGPAAIILAAGKGTRMGSELPKVLHPVGGRPMICAVVEACRSAGCGAIVVVVGHGQELVREALAEFDVSFAVQAEQRGTAHAVQCAKSSLGEQERTGDVFVLCGDGPLIRPETLCELLRAHRKSGAAATLATSVLDDPTGYGRIVRDAEGRFTGIVEEKNATAAQRAIREINPSYYCFDGEALFEYVARIAPNEVSGELYLTDVPALLMDDGRKVEVIQAVDPEDVMSINTPEDLARVDAIYRARTAAGAWSATR